MHITETFILQVLNFLEAQLLCNQGTTHRQIDLKILTIPRFFVVVISYYQLLPSVIEFCFVHLFSLLSIG